MSPLENQDATFKTKKKKERPPSIPVTISPFRLVLCTTVEEQLNVETGNHSCCKNNSRLVFVRLTLIIRYHWFQLITLDMKGI